MRPLSRGTHARREDLAALGQACGPADSSPCSQPWRCPGACTPSAGAYSRPCLRALGHEACREARALTPYSSSPSPYGLHTPAAPQDALETRLPVLTRSVARSVTTGHACVEGVLNRSAAGTTPAGEQRGLVPDVKVGLYTPAAGGPCPPHPPDVATLRGRSNSLSLRRALYWRQRSLANPATCVPGSFGAGVLLSGRPSSSRPLLFFRLGETQCNPGGEDVKAELLRGLSRAEDGDLDIFPARIGLRRVRRKNKNCRGRSEDRGTVEHNAKACPKGARK